MGAKSIVHQRATRGRPRGGRNTRDAIMTVAVHLLKTEGETAISTSRLTREAGIVQSGFYNHFPTLDACLAQAATAAAEEIREPVRASLRRLRAEERQLGQPSSGPARAHFRRVLDLLAPRWPVFAVLRDGTRTDSPVAQAVRQVHHDVTTDVADYVRLFATQHGLALTEHDPRVTLLSVLLVDLTLCAAQERARNPDIDPDLVATMLSDCSRAMVVRITHGDDLELTWTDPTRR